MDVLSGWTLHVQVRWAGLHARVAGWQGGGCGVSGLGNTRGAFAGGQLSMVHSAAAVCKCTKV